MHYISYNTFFYNYNKSGFKYCFNFFRLLVQKTYVDIYNNLNFKQNNI